MKKIVVLLTAVLMFFMVPLSAQAAKTKLTVSDASAERAQMVYLSVELKDCAKANTMAISMDYDKSVLKKVASDCKWTQKGAMQDFDVAKDYGVWMSDDSEKIDGQICTLAFRVKADAPIGETQVSCTITVKKDSKVIGTYTAQGTINVTCEHIYDKGTEKDSEVHIQRCGYCGNEETAVHTWDSGKVILKPTEIETGIREYTCKICKAAKQEVLPAIGISDSEATENDSNTVEDTDKNETSTDKPESTPNSSQSSDEVGGNETDTSSNSENQQSDGSHKNTASNGFLWLILIVIVGGIAGFVGYKKRGEIR